MEYISVREAARKWGITERRVRALCESGRIETAVRCGDWMWSIPSDAPKPSDGRKLRYVKNRGLKTGTQDFAIVDKVRKSSRSTVLTVYQKASIMQDAFAYESIFLEKTQILSVLRLEKQDIDLKNQVMLLNIDNAMNAMPFDITEKSICDVNKRILMSIDEKSGGKYKTDANQREEIQAVMSQYTGPWSVLHPIARAAFLFSELLRIDLFEKAGVQTAFLVLCSEMLKAKLPPAIFGTERMPELKAALASSSLRGNAQTLISMLLETEGSK